MSEPIRTRRPIHTTISAISPFRWKCVDVYRIDEGEYVVEVSIGRGLRPHTWETIRVRPFDLRA